MIENFLFSFVSFVWRLCQTKIRRKKRLNVYCFLWHSVCMCHRFRTLFSQATGMRNEWGLIACTFSQRPKRWQLNKLILWIVFIWSSAFKRNRCTNCRNANSNFSGEMNSLAIQMRELREREQQKRETYILYLTMNALKRQNFVRHASFPSFIQSETAACQLTVFNSKAKREKRTIRLNDFERKSSGENVWREERKRERNEVGVRLNLLIN